MIHETKYLRTVIQNSIGEIDFNITKHEKHLLHISIFKSTKKQTNYIANKLKYKLHSKPR